MDKDCGIGHYSLHRVQLSPFKGHITGMSGGGHRLFQGVLQVEARQQLHQTRPYLESEQKLVDQSVFLQAIAESMVSSQHTEFFHDGV